MALTGLQIFKLLPGTNCRKCNYPTCLAFAMKLAAGREALESCPDASDELKAALGAASLPPIRKVTLGRGERAVTVGEETVFFRHEKTFVRPTGLFAAFDSAGTSEADVKARLEELAAISIERAGEVFRVDGIAVRESSASLEQVQRAVSQAAELGLPVALRASTPEGAEQILKGIAKERPLLVPPAQADQAPYVALAASLHIPLVVYGTSMDGLCTTAEQVAKKGVEDILLAPLCTDSAALHTALTRLRRGALERIHPGIAYPILLQIGAGELEKAVIGISKFASLLILEQAPGVRGGEMWLPLWTLRQNLYTDPQKPLQIDPGLYPIGEPDASSPVLLTTNFSLTYFIVSSEIESTGVPCHLVVADAEGMSVLTAWSAGKFGGEKLAKIMSEMGVSDVVQHRLVVIPGYVACIAGELEDALGTDWKVLVGPQEASDIRPFLRDVWQGITAGQRASA